MDKTDVIEMTGGVSFQVIGVSRSEIHTLMTQSLQPALDAAGLRQRKKGPERLARGMNAKEKFGRSAVAQKLGLSKTSSNQEAGEWEHFASGAMRDDEYYLVSRVRLGCFVGLIHMVLDTLSSVPDAVSSVRVRISDDGGDVCTVVAEPADPVVAKIPKVLGCGVAVLALLLGGALAGPTGGISLVVALVLGPILWLTLGSFQKAVESRRARQSKKCIEIVQGLLG